MNFEIISVGTELLLGQIVNTNAQAISRMLSELGMNVYYTTVVGDNPERLRAALEDYHNRRTGADRRRSDQGDDRGLLRTSV